MPTYNQTQQVTRQLEGTAVGECRPRELVDMKLIRQCRHRLDAIRLCASLSGLSYETLAERIGMDKGNFTRVMQGRASFPDDHRLELFYDACGNDAPIQYEAWRRGFVLLPERRQLGRTERQERRQAA